ncbi:MAG: Sau3AI family type II restriction endonuclease [Acholeplasmataceae bacterium]
MSKPKTVEQLRDMASGIIGIPFSAIDKNGRLATGKGAVGTMIEESWFGQTPHNDEKPDFADLGIELKVTPYLKNKAFRSKERLVCNMINFMKEHEYIDFESSSFYRKCNSILMLFYQHLIDKPKSDYKISHAKFITLAEIMKNKYGFFFLLPDEDIEIMRQDWEKIVSKIRDGKAHEISEGDTNYLGACTKASDSSKRVKQPFSKLEAKPRAFSIKQSYMTYILNNYVINQLESERLITDGNLLKTKTFEEVILEKFEPYYGKTDVELAEHFKIDTKSKSFKDRIIAAILGIKGSINQSEEFQKASITSKTIRVETNGSIKESMSFPKINFIDLVDEEWEESKFYNQIGLSRFMFSIFKKQGAGYVLKRVKFWNMPEQDLEEAKKVWEHTKDLVKSNNIVIGGKYGYSVENFPQSSQNEVSHVRPHDRDLRAGRTLLPNGKMISNYCFWLNTKYVRTVIED